jgi:Holliday junction resolvase
MRAAKADLNQPEIVAALRKLGCCVMHMHTLGKGVPDILVARRGRLWLVEVKGPKGKLTPDQEVFHAAWPVHVVRSVDDAIKLVGAA